MAPFYRTRGSCSNLKDSQFRIDIRKKSFTVRMVNHWNRLQRAVVDEQSLEMLKGILGGALRT